MSLETHHIIEAMSKYDWTKEQEQECEPKVGKHHCLSELALEARRALNEEYAWNNTPKRDHKIAKCKEVSMESVLGAADHLIRSHLYSAVRAAWSNRMDLVVWIDADINAIQGHPRAQKSCTSYRGTFGCGAPQTKSRSYSFVKLDDKYYGLSPAMNSFRLFPGTIWTRIGCRYKEAVIPSVDSTARSATHFS